jgi:hypothetical protein
VDGRDLGWFVSHRDAWRPGDTIGSSEMSSRVVLAVVEPPDDADFRAYLLVVFPEDSEAAEAVAS